MWLQIIILTDGTGTGVERGSVHQGLLRLGGAQGREPPQESPEDCEPEGAVLEVDVVAVNPGDAGPPSSRSSGRSSWQKQ